MESLTERRNAVLAALATIPGASFEPVQVQKLFFLLNERVSDKGWKRQFRFEPHFFGPYDANVYTELEVLKQEGLVDIWEANLREYSLSAEGYEKGQEALGEFPSAAKDAMRSLSEWVRDQTFAGLVSAIYKQFPKMKVNSIFQ